MEHVNVLQEPFFSVSCHKETVRLIQDAIACYDRVLDCKRGRLAPEKWNLAYETMQQMKSKLKAHAQASESTILWLSYDETWAFSVALQLYLRRLDTQPSSAVYARDAGPCFLLLNSCIEVLEGKSLP